MKSLKQPSPFDVSQPSTLFDKRQKTVMNKLAVTTDAKIRIFTVYTKAKPFGDK